jgi:hypothetical protein
LLFDCFSPILPCFVQCSPWFEHRFDARLAWSAFSQHEIDGHDSDGPRCEVQHTLWAWNRSRCFQGMMTRCQARPANVKSALVCFYGSKCFQLLSPACPRPLPPNNGQACCRTSRRGRTRRRCRRRRRLAPWATPGTSTPRLRAHGLGAPAAERAGPGPRVKPRPRSVKPRPLNPSFRTSPSPSIVHVGVHSSRVCEGCGGGGGRVLAADSTQMPLIMWLGGEGAGGGGG